MAHDWCQRQQATLATRLIYNFLFAASHAERRQQKSVSCEATRWYVPLGLVNCFLNQSISQLINQWFLAMNRPTEEDESLNCHTDIITLSLHNYVIVRRGGVVFPIKKSWVRFPAVLQGASKLKRQIRKPQFLRNAWFFLHQILLICSIHNCL